MRRECIKCDYIRDNAFGEFGAPEQKRGKHNSSYFAFPGHWEMSALLELHLRAHSINLPYSVVNQGRRLKIERTIILEASLLCVLNINKDFILYVFVNKQDLGLAFDAVKKVTEFINSSAKMFVGSSGPARLDVITKKFVEIMSVMEEFLYTREISIREHLSLQPQPNSRKKNADQEIFNKFSHITN